MSTKTLIFGAGWLGQQFADFIETSYLSRVDATDEKALLAEIERVAPARIINCVGRTGRPNIDACERDPVGTYRANVVAALILAAMAKKRGIQFIHMSSGCLYEGDRHGQGFREEDPPNFLGSLYSRTKAVSEMALRDFDALQLRIRMPLSAHPHPRNLLTKLVGYKRVIREPNSVTVLEDFFPSALRLMEMGKTGVFNMVNEGIEYHDELLNLYREIADPHFQFEVISTAQLRSELQAGRSNCILNSEKLHQSGAGMPPLRDSLPKLLRDYAHNLTSRPKH